MSEVDRLEIKVESEAKKAVSNLDLLITRLNTISGSLSSVNSGGLLQLANGVNHLATSMQKMQGVHLTDFNRIANGINKLSSLDTNSIYRASNAMRNMATSLSTMSGASGSAQGITELATAISKLGYKSSSNAITNLPLLSTAIKNMMQTLSTAPAVSKNVIELANSLSNLAAQGSKVGSSVRSVNSVMKAASKSTKNYGNSAKNARLNSTSLTSQFMKLASAIFAVKNLISTLSKSIKSALDYGETINLFQTSLKKVGLDAAKDAGYEIGSKAAENYAIGFMRNSEQFSEEISEKLGLNVNTTKNYQAMFAQMTNTIGLTAKSADTVSRSFTALGNDIASLWNIDTESAMTKLQAGLAGQVKPLRELGIDITNATLQTYAYKYGIEDSVTKMSQAAKEQLRYIAIMDQTKVAHGDMAKTLNSGANQLRILKQSWDNLCRSIGNVFIPLMNTVLPYVNGFLMALRNIVDAFAMLNGYEEPDFSDSQISTDITGDLLDVDGAIGDIGDDAEDSTKAVDKLKKSLASFDELNVLNESNGSSSNNNGASYSSSVDGGYSQLDDVIGKQSESYFDKFNSNMDGMKNKAKEISEYIQPKLEKFIQLVKDLEPLFIGIATGVGVYKLITMFQNICTSIAELTANPAGQIALLIGGLALLSAALVKCWDDAKEKDIAKRFGDVKLSLSDLKDLAKEIADNGTLDYASLFGEEYGKLDGMKTDLEELDKKIKTYNWKIEIGMELTEWEMADYKQTILDYISKCETYIDQKQLSVTMAVDLLLNDGENQDTVIGTINNFYASKKDQLANKASELTKYINEAFSDGLFTFDEEQKAKELLGELQSVLTTISGSKIEASIQRLDLKYSGIELNVDTYKQLMDEAQKIIDEQAQINSEALDLTIQNAKIMLDEGAIDQSEYDRRITEYKAGYLENIGEVTLRVSKYNLQTLYDAFPKELDSATPDIKAEVQKIYKKWATVDDNGKQIVDMDGFTREIEDKFKTGMLNITPEAMSNLKEFIEKLQPQTDQFKSQALQWLSLGEEIPKEVAQGLLSDMYLQSVTGNIGALYALMSMQVTDSDKKKELLNIAKHNGYEVDNKILSGISKYSYLVDDGICELINGMKTDIKTEVKGILPGVKENGKSVNSGIASGINNKAARKNVTKAINDMIIQINEQMGTNLDIVNNSSRKFEKHGENSVNGYYNGINAAVERKNAKQIKHWTDQILTDFEAGLDIHSPSKKFEKDGVYSVEGYNIGVDKSIDSTKQTITKWGNTIKQTAGNISVPQFNMTGNYKLNTDGIKGFNDIVGTSQVMLQSRQSVNIDQTSNSLMNLPSMVAEAVYGAITSAPIKAEIPRNEVANSVKQSDREHYNQTGKHLFAY